MTTGMSIDERSLYRLMSWLSPSYPVGAFSHSHGLEWCVGSGEVATRAGLGDWITDVLEHGGGRQDAILFAITHRTALAGSWADLAEVVALAAALNPSKERAMETMKQGRAFALATRKAWPSPLDAQIEDLGPESLAYPIAVALAAAGHAVARGPALTAYLHAFATNIVSAGMRLIPLGQSDGQAIIVALEAVIYRATERALDATIEDLGSATLLTDIASMRHETQYTRLFHT